METVARNQEIEELAFQVARQVLSRQSITLTP